MPPKATESQKTSKLKKATKHDKRRSGILLHPTSLPGQYGIGDLGKAAYEFVDFLVAAKQTLWQVLPLGHTSFGDSPYQTFCAFAGNPLLISPDALLEEGWLNKEDIANLPDFDPKLVSYGEVIDYKTGIFKKAFSTFKSSASKINIKEFSEFCKKHASWLDSYSLFMALKNHYISERKETFETEEYHIFKKSCENLYTQKEIDDSYYGGSWHSWDTDIMNRNPSAINKWKKKLKDDIEFYSFLQYEFYREWNKLKKYANSLKVEIIGDIPIFVAMDSADVWASRDLFMFDKNGHPKAVAGVPPDYFSEKGQLWGNPLYEWSEHKSTNFEWWIRRVKHTLSQFDIIRIDHFRGFDEYWAVPFGEETAIKGKWLQGPGKKLFDTIKKELGDVDIIAEDLGILTDSVESLRDDLKFPGMKVLQFAFSEGIGNLYLPHNFVDTNTVVYTGTHDNDTSASWYDNASDYEKDYFRKYLNADGSDAAWNLIRLAMSSTANYAIFPLQDVMSLKGEARMNTPGVRDNNWQFRFTNDMLKKEYADGLEYLSKVFERNCDLRV